MKVDAYTKDLHRHRSFSISAMENCQKNIYRNIEKGNRIFDEAGFKLNDLAFWNKITDDHNVDQLIDILMELKGKY